MANEITLTATLAYDDSELTDILLSAEDIVRSVSTKVYTKNKHNVGTTEEAMELGTVTSLGWCMIVNRDATNFVSVLAATAGTNIIRVPPLSPALFHFGSGVTAPYLIANTAACQVEYLIVSQ